MNSTSEIAFKKILIVEHDSEILNTYSLLLKEIKGFQVSGKFNNCELALNFLRKRTPDLILLDIEFPGMSGLEFIKRVRKDNSEIKILVVTTCLEDSDIFQALAAGINGLINRDFNYKKLLDAVDKVIDGELVFTDSISKMVFNSFQKNPNSPLTDRETEVLEQLARAKTYKIIADELGISVGTIKTHVESIYYKLEVDNKNQALILARKLSLI